MRLLLDTQVALTCEARGRILDAHNEVFVSVATLWEIAIKTNSVEVPCRSRRGGQRNCSAPREII